MKSFSEAKGKQNLKSLKNRTILLGVTGGIAAYKSAELVRRFTDHGASVNVIMTGAAQQFITPLTFQTLSRNPVYTSLFQDPLKHISLASEADLMVIAPATANIIGKLANGIADDMLSTVFLAFKGPVVIAPSMNWKMYENPAVRENLKVLGSRGCIIVGPESGSLACGEEGKGRLSDIGDIVDAAAASLITKDLAGRRMVVTAGPTREYIDPVRFISNRSSGKMGWSLAKAARDRGAEVVLISGPTSLADPKGIRTIRVETAEMMLLAVLEEVSRSASVLIMAAAVADFRPSEPSAVKLGKTAFETLRLEFTGDVISKVASSEKRPFIIGFAAETGSNVDRAREKMLTKGMDMIVFNDVTEEGAGFETDTNRVTIIDRNGSKATDLLHKDLIADEILDRYLQITA